MSKHPYHNKSATYLILRDRDQILLSRRYNTGYRDGEYSMVAGHVDPGESVIQSIVREAKEEAGVIVKEEDLKLVHVQSRLAEDGVEYIDFYFECEDWQGEVEIKEPNKCDDMRWVGIDDLPENTLDYIKVVVESYREGNTYSNYGWAE